MSDTAKTWIEERRAARVPNSTLSVSDAHNNLPRALDAIDQVLELHHGDRDEHGCWTCRFCSHIQQAKILHPCATVRAIEGAFSE